MDTQNKNHKGEVEVSKDITHEIKESIRKDILSKLFDENSSLSTKKDTDVLRMVLIEDKKLSEVCEKLNLPPLEISQFFYRALRRVNLRFETFNSQMESTDDLREELFLLRKKLQQYETKENKVSRLSLERIDLLAKDICDVGLSGRVWRTLYAIDVRTIDDLVRMPKLKFLSCRNVGNKSIKELDEFLESKGLSWEMKI